MGNKRSLYRQLGLRSGSVSIVANVEDQPKLRSGNSLTLKDDDREWSIEWVSPQLIERYKLERSWNNNI